MSAIEGVDYADARPSPAKLYALGKRFVVRYGGPGRTSKQLSASELKGLLDAGLSVVANAEGAADGYRGRTVGRAWAKQAEEHFRSLGMPGDRPIYFSVDWAAGPDDWADIDAALRGSAEIIGADRVGVYGGYSTIAHCMVARTARWFWQTYAWSGGKWHPAAHMQQYHNGVTVAGGDCDLNRAMVADYGQWGHKKELVMAIEDADAEKIASAVWGRMFTRPNGADAHGNKQTSAGAYQAYSDMQAETAASRVIATLAPLIKGVDVDESAIAQAVVAGLSPEGIAQAVLAGVGPEIAQQVVAEMGTLLSSGNQPAEQG